MEPGLEQGLSQQAPIACFHPKNFWFSLSSFEHWCFVKSQLPCPSVLATKDVSSTAVGEGSSKMEELNVLLFFFIYLHKRTAAHSLQPVFFAVSLFS